MRIAIAITTRHRPDTLKHSLAHHARFSPFPIVIVSDDDPNPLAHYVSPRRLGIAQAKNACITLLQQRYDPDFYFLMDDDCHPIGDNWHLPFTLLPHTQLIVQHPGYYPVSSTDHSNLGVFERCMGCCLVFSREAIQVLGGYDTFPNPYGYEHAQLSQRAYRAGLIPAPYISPLVHSLYSLDVSPRYYHYIPHPPNPSSVTAEEIDNHKLNAPLMDNPPIFIERGPLP